MARQTRSEVRLEKRNDNRVSNGTGPLSIARNILGFNYYVWRYSNSIVKTEDTHTHGDLTAAGQAEILLRRSQMLQ